MAFDVHLAETFVPLALGITLVCAPRTQLLEDLPKWIRTLSITHVGIVPSLIEATMCAVEQSVDEEGEFKLKYIASGGEKMSDSVRFSSLLVLVTFILDLDTDTREMG